MDYYSKYLKYKNKYLDLVGIVLLLYIVINCYKL